jgi:hypothetical protein
MKMGTDWPVNSPMGSLSREAGELFQVPAGLSAIRKLSSWNLRGFFGCLFPDDCAGIQIVLGVMANYA